MIECEQPEVEARFNQFFKIDWCEKEDAYVLVTHDAEDMGDTTPFTDLVTLPSDPGDVVEVEKWLGDITERLPSGTFACPFGLFNLENPCLIHNSDTHPYIFCDKMDNGMVFNLNQFLKLRFMPKSPQLPVRRSWVFSSDKAALLCRDGIANSSFSSSYMYLPCGERSTLELAVGNTTLFNHCRKLAAKHGFIIHMDAKDGQDIEMGQEIYSKFSKFILEAIDNAPLGISYSKLYRLLKNDGHNYLEGFVSEGLGRFLLSKSLNIPYLLQNFRFPEGYIVGDSNKDKNGLKPIAWPMVGGMSISHTYSIFFISKNKKYKIKTDKLNIDNFRNFFELFYVSFLYTHAFSNFNSKKFFCKNPDSYKDLDCFNVFGSSSDFFMGYYNSVIETAALPDRKSACYNKDYKILRQLWTFEGLNLNRYKKLLPSVQEIKACLKDPENSDFKSEMNPFWVLRFFRIKPHFGQFVSFHPERFSLSCINRAVLARYVEEYRGRVEKSYPDWKWDDAFSKKLVAALHHYWLGLVASAAMAPDTRYYAKASGLQSLIKSVS
jgi:hypothetical protein